LLVPGGVCKSRVRFDWFRAESGYLLKPERETKKVILTNTQKVACY